MVSTPFVPVPPPRYGGTELVVAELVTALAAAGHEVTLFATGDSRPPAEIALRARFPRAVWPPAPYAELEHAGVRRRGNLADARGFDVVHAHVPSPLPFGRMLEAPFVYTVHHADGATTRGSRRCTRAAARTSWPSASGSAQLMPALAEAQRDPSRADPPCIGLGRGDGGYVAFLGRFARDKGPHVAIDVARAAGLPIRIAGAPHPRRPRLFRARDRRAAGSPGVTAVGEVGGGDKRGFLGDALALLFPVAGKSRSGWR